MRGNTIFPQIYGAFLKSHPQITIETVEETTKVLERSNATSSKRKRNPSTV